MYVLFEHFLPKRKLDTKKKLENEIMKLKTAALKTDIINAEKYLGKFRG